MNSRPLEDLQTFVLLATDDNVKPITREQWVAWISMVEQTAQEAYMLKSVTHSTPTDPQPSYVAIGLATASRLKQMRATLREIRENHWSGNVSIAVVDDLDETI